MLYCGRPSILQIGLLFPSSWASHGSICIISPKPIIIPSRTERSSTQKYCMSMTIEYVPQFRHPSGLAHHSRSLVCIPSTQHRQEGRMCYDKRSGDCVLSTENLAWGRGCLNYLLCSYLGHCLPSCIDLTFQIQIIMLEPFHKRDRRLQIHLPTGSKAMSSSRLLP
jgi:hypothetical protein